MRFIASVSFGKDSLAKTKLFKVYKHTFPNGKVYIGITSKENVNQRWLKGLGYKHCPYIFNAILKYGWDNIKHEILLENLTEQEAQQKEIELIALYKSNNKRFGYNIENGGKGEYRMTEEIKEKISNSLKGKPSWNKGKKLSAQHIENLKKSHMGKTKEKCHNAKCVLQYDTNMRLIAEYNCVINASDATRISKTLIARCARKECKYAGGFIWIYKKDI